MVFKITIILLISSIITINGNDLDENHVTTTTAETTAATMVLSDVTKVNNNNNNKDEYDYTDVKLRMITTTIDPEERENEKVTTTIKPDQKKKFEELPITTVKVVTTTAKPNTVITTLNMKLNSMKIDSDETETTRNPKNMKLLHTTNNETDEKIATTMIADEKGINNINLTTKTPITLNAEAITTTFTPFTTKIVLDEKKKIDSSSSSSPPSSLKSDTSITENSTAKGLSSSTVSTIEKSNGTTKISNTSALDYNKITTTSTANTTETLITSTPTNEYTTHLSKNNEKSTTKEILNRSETMNNEIVTSSPIIKTITTRKRRIAERTTEITTTTELPITTTKSVATTAPIETTMSSKENNLNFTFTDSGEHNDSLINVTHTSHETAFTTMANRETSTTNEANKLITNFLNDLTNTTTEITIINESLYKDLTTMQPKEINVTTVISLDDSNDKTVSGAINTTDSQSESSEANSSAEAEPQTFEKPEMKMKKDIKDESSLVMIVFDSSEFDIYSWISEKEKIFREFIERKKRIIKKYLHIFYLKPIPKMVDDKHVVIIFGLEKENNQSENEMVKSDEIINHLHERKSLLEEKLSMKIICYTSMSKSKRCIKEEKEKFAKIEIIIIALVIAFVCCACILTTLLITYFRRKGKTFDFKYIERQAISPRTGFTNGTMTGCNLNSDEDILRDELRNKQDVNSLHHIPNINHYKASSQQQQFRPHSNSHDNCWVVPMDNASNRNNNNNNDNFMPSFKSTKTRAKEANNNNIDRTNNKNISLSDTKL